MAHLAKLLLALSLTGLSIACTAPADTEEEENVETSNASIVGGTEATEGSWAGAAMLLKGGTRPVCGGTLIADSWVLTAAHCVSTSSPTTGGFTSVILGRHRISDTTKGETRTVDRAFRHAAYGSMNNDIALLHLSTPASPSIARAKLVTSADLRAIVAGANSVVVGWGRTGEGAAGTTPADALRQVTVPIIANDICKAYPRYQSVTDNMICAGFASGQFDSCQGDSGGPQYMVINNQKKQIGLVSWGIGCARPNAPGVYTRVGNYLNWLYEKTEGAVGEAPTATDGGASSSSQ